MCKKYRKKKGYVLSALRRQENEQCCPDPHPANHQKSVSHSRDPCVCVLLPPPLPTRAKAEEGGRVGRPRMRYEQGRVGESQPVAHGRRVAVGSCSHVAHKCIKRSHKGLYIATGLPTAWCARLKVTCLK